jgi:chorismate mutase
MLNKKLNRKFQKKILNFRTRIDLFDDELCVLLRNRQRIVDRIQKIKSRHGIPSRDHFREREIMRRLMLKNPSLRPKLLTKIFKALFNSAYR